MGYTIFHHVAAMVASSSSWRFGSVYVVLIGSSGSEWDDDNWSSACVLAEPRTGHPFRTFVEAFDHADAFVEREWTVARLETDASKP